jgi:hypothetical protein
LGGKLESQSTRIFATLILVTGMGTSTTILVASAEPSPIAPDHVDADADAAKGDVVGLRAKSHIEVKAIATAQAITMLAVPLAAIAMVVVLFDRRATGDRDLPLAVKAFVLFGAGTLLGIALMMYWKLKPQLAEILPSILLPRVD